MQNQVPKPKTCLSTLLALAMLPVVLMLQACGGADGAVDASRPPTSWTSDMVAAAQASPSSLPGTEGRRHGMATRGTINTDQLLDWAERSYPDLFPKGPSTQRLAAGGVAYTVRYYPGTGNYVGVTDDGGVWGYGPFTDYTLRNYGKVAEYTCLVSPALCDAAPVACKTEISTGFTGDLNATYLDAGGAADGSGADGGSAGVGGSEGKVLGGRIKVIRLSDGVVLGEGVTDSKLGLTTVKWCKADMPVMLEMSGAPGAKYFDEAVNDFVDFPLTQKLRALVDRFDENVGVSALTEAAYMYAMNNIVNDPGPVSMGSGQLQTDGVPLGMTSAQVQQVNALVLDEVNRLFTDSLQQLSAKSLATPIDQRSGDGALPNNRYGRIAALTGGFARIAATYAQISQAAMLGTDPTAGATGKRTIAGPRKYATAAPAFDFARQFSEDFTDGQINGFNLAGRNIAELGARTFNSAKTSENWTLGEGLMSTRFGANTTLLGTEDFIATTISTGYAPDCPSEKYIGTYYLGKGGAVAEVMRIPGSCQASGSGYYTYNKNFLARVRSLSDYHVSKNAFAIMLDGKVSSWGQNRCGSLGISSSGDEFLKIPQHIEGLARVVQVTAVNGATFALTAEGDVYGWGPNDDNIFGFMGMAFDGVCHAEFFSRPRKIEQLKNIKFLSGGGYSGLIVVDVDGYITTIADSIFLPDSSGGGLAHGMYRWPKPLAGVVKVEPLSYATTALRRDGTVWAWLNNVPVPSDGHFSWQNLDASPKVPLVNTRNAVDITTDARKNILISLDSRGVISIHSGNCRDTLLSPPFPFNDIVLNREIVPAATFPIRRQGKNVKFPRAVRLTRINDSVAFVGADGLTYALNAEGNCGSWAWVAIEDQKLADLKNNDGQPIADLTGVRSAACHRRPSDYLCQEFNGSAVPFGPSGQAAAVDFVIEGFVGSDVSDALKISNYYSDAYMEYPLSPQFPRSGSIELRVFVDHAVERVRNRTSGSSQGTLDGCAPLVLSDWKDVPWPGGTWFYACPNGTVRLEMSVANYSSVKQIVQAENTAFRFRKWSRLGFSYGQFGQSISVDGKVVASNPSNTQPLGSGGNSIQPRNKLNLGFYRSDVVGREEGGFEGAVDWFRVSKFPNDWVN